MTDYIVAIDLGSSHITGIVGEKNADGTFSIVACETENPFSCIRRGNIHNLEDTADHVGNLIKKLERQLKGRYIDKVYIGVGGQSLRTIDHVEGKDIAQGAAVTKDDIKELKEQCEKYTPDLLDVLDITPAVYYLDGRRETKPVGVPCKRFEAHYKLVIGRASIRRDILNSIRDRAKINIAGIIVSPLALADAMLSKEEKELGCALVDFGAGVTSVCVYKDETLLYMSVIPLGGNLITRDITSLQLTEAEAEKLKKEQGSAILYKEREGEVIPVDDMDGVDRKIEANDLNAIIEGRAKEIVENVYAHINEVVEVKSLGSGIVLAGCAAELKNLPELIRERCKAKAKVRHSTICRGLVRGSDDMLGNPLYMPAISLMLKGTESCVSRPFAEPGTENTSDVNVDITMEKDVNRNPTVKKEPVKKNKRKTLSGLIKDIFNEE
jgi:cell division protein FtsA